MGTRPARDDEARAKRALERLHIDLRGPLEASESKNKYFLGMVDEFTKYSVVRCLKDKADVYIPVQEVIRALQRQTGLTVTYVRSDNGGEFTSKHLSDFFKEEGITPEFTSTYSPQSNGMAERLNRTLMEKVRPMMFEAGVPTRFWDRAIDYANVLRNHSPVTGSDKTPVELLYGRQPDVSAFKVFGALAYPNVPITNTKRSGKLTERADRGVLLGYNPKAKQYLVFVDGEVHHVRDAKVEEAVRGWRALYPDDVPEDEDFNRWYATALAERDQSPSAAGPGAAADDRDKPIEEPPA
ncbi:MAG: DDE-type integrase/transposase/recombinase, partial [Rhodoferax sp.]|nr:DDE-type integrase/transposase/recombinase [Rhodoferax sp.]